VLISLWKSGDEGQLTVRPSTFFPGLHNFCASHGARREIIREAVKNSVLTGKDVSEWGERFRGARKSCGTRRQRRRSVPLGRALEVNFDRLLRIGDVKPAAIGFPAIGDNLDEHSAGLCAGNVSDTFSVGLDVQFQFLVLQKLALLDIFHVDAGVFDGTLLSPPVTSIVIRSSASGRGDCVFGAGTGASWAPEQGTKAARRSKIRVNGKRTNRNRNVFMSCWITSSTEDRCGSSHSAPSFDAGRDGCAARAVAAIRKELARQN
jgi:hypothetical protein